MGDTSLVRKAAACDRYLWPLSNLYVKLLARKGLIFGFGAYNRKVIEDGFRRLAAIMCVE